MAKIDEVYEYLIGIYKPDEPIFLSEVSIPDMRYGCRYLRILSDEPLEKAVFETMKEKGIFA